MSGKFSVAVTAWILLLSIGSLSWAERLGVTGLVFEDANSNRVFDVGEKSLQGVVISDGKTVTVTNEQGFYKIQTDAGSIVFVSVPGTHHAPGNKFYHSLDEAPTVLQKTDFPLVLNADAVDDKKFAFVFVTDTHVGYARRAKEGVTKAYESIADLNPAFVIHGGDIVLDALKVLDEKQAQEQYDLYKNQLVPIIKSPFYHTVGNHDVFGWAAAPDLDPVPGLYGKKMYKRYFGPAYYSFNYEHCHFAVLDSIARTRIESGEVTYYGFIDPTQLEWLRKDLLEAGRSRPVVIVTHIPTINALSSCFGLRNEIVPMPTGEKTLKHQISNFPQLLGEVLKGYNFKLALAGHYHTYEEVRWKDNEHDGRFVVGGSVCGEWWKGDRVIGHASWPEGFTVVNVKGENFEISYVPYGWHGIEEE